MGNQASGLFTSPQLRAAAADTLDRLRRDASTASPKLQAVLAYVTESLFEPSLRVSQLHRECGLSAAHLYQLFRDELGTSPGAYVAELRCETAARLLADTDLVLAEIAGLVGFPSTGTFFRTFRQRRGVTPGAFRTEAGNEAAPASSRWAEELRQCLLGHGGAEETQAIADAIELAHLRGSPPETAERLRDRAGLARLEAHALELLRPRYLQWPAARQYALARRGYRPSTPAFFRRLLRQSREEGRDDRGRGLWLAELALESVWALREAVSEQQLSNLLAEAHAHLGNARRLLFYYEGAERSFARAEAELAKHPAPAEVEAEVLRLKGTLRRFQRRLPEARELLDRSLAKTIDPTRSARTLLSRGIVFELQGDELAAESDYAEAQRQLRDSMDTYLRFSAHVALGVFHARQGAYRRAEAELAEARRLAPAIGSRRVDYHVLWVEGLYRHARGQWDLAERRLAETRQGFLELGEPVFAALVGLDLALALCQKHRMAEVEELMAEALPLFEKLHFDTEGLSALRLLQRAAAQREITAALLTRLRDQLELAGIVPRRP